MPTPLVNASSACPMPGPSCKKIIMLLFNSYDSGWVTVADGKSTVVILKTQSFAVLIASFKKKLRLQTNNKYTRNVLLHFRGILLFNLKKKNNENPPKVF